MPGKVPENVIWERYHELMSLQSKISEEVNRSMEGRELEVLVEGFGEEDGVAYGRSYREAPEVDGLVFVEGADGAKPGDFVRVRVEQGFAYDLVGTLAT